MARDVNRSDRSKQKPVVRQGGSERDGNDAATRMGRSRKDSPAQRNSRVGPSTRSRSLPREQGMSSKRSVPTRPHARVAPRRGSRSGAPFVMVPRDRSGKDGAKMKPGGRRGPSKQSSVRSRSSSGSKSKSAPRRSNKGSGGKKKGGKKK